METHFERSKDLTILKHLLPCHFEYGRHRSFCVDFVFDSIFIFYTHLYCILISSVYCIEYKEYISSVNKTEKKVLELFC